MEQGISEQSGTAPAKSSAQDTEDPRIRDGWTRPLPATLPQPTYWPAAMALGIVFILWGFTTTLIITGVGLAIFAVSMAGWIREVQRES